MRGKTRVLLGLALLLTGCTALRVEYQELRDPEQQATGQIQFLALRGHKPDKPANGYAITVMRNDAVVGTFESSSSQAIATAPLAPGSYNVSISGRKIGTQDAQIEVRPGQATVVCLLVRNARRTETANDVAITTGKVVLYTVGCVLYAAVWLTLECLSGDDDDDSNVCSRCGHQSCTCPPAYKRATPPGPVSEYRSKK
jgi:hypothetical protein